MSHLPTPKKKRFYRRWWFWVLSVIAVVIVGGSIAGAVSYKSVLRSQFEYLNETLTVEDRKIAKTISTNGTLTPDNISQLFIGSGRRVTDVNYQVGDDVVKGDDLIRTEGGGLVEAPFDGTVLKVNTFEGDIPTGTTPVIELGFRSNHVQFVASEAEVIDLRVGQHVTLTVPSYKDGKDTFDSKVLFVDTQKQTFGATTASASSESGYMVKVSADNLPEEIKGLVGLSVDLTVDIYETSEVPSIEPSAIQYDENDEPFVYLPPELTDEFLQEASMATDITDLLERRDVSIGFKGDDYVEITDGLNDGDVVLLYVPATAAPSLF